MGGYGCFKLALAKSFSHAASFSGALSFQDFFSQREPKFGSTAYWRGVFGEIKDWSAGPYSLESLAKNLTKDQFGLGVVSRISCTEPIISQWKSQNWVDVTYSHLALELTSGTTGKTIGTVLIATLPIEFKLEEIKLV